MNATNDPIFVYLRPTLLSEKDYKRDIEELVENGAYHSDEISETDEEKAQKEITDHIRPKNKDETDKHVIHVYDKSWRSGKVYRESSFAYFIIFINLFIISLLYICCASD
jgi:hypothetical protein